MKPETVQEKLNRLLGLGPKVEEVKAKIEARKGSKFVAVPETEIQNYREVQGLIYFLQAPKLFTPMVCKECETPYLVSRMNVAYCSYQCIRKSLNKLGFDWKKGDDLEALVNDPEVYNGNEPLWITNLESLEKALLQTQKALSSSSQTTSSGAQ